MSKRPNVRQLVREFFLAHQGKAFSPKEVAAALHDSADGWAHDPSWYYSVASAMANMARRSDIVKVGPGQYEANRSGVWP